MLVFYSIFHELVLYVPNGLGFHIPYSIYSLSSYVTLHIHINCHTYQRHSVLHAVDTGMFTLELWKFVTIIPLGSLI